MIPFRGGRASERCLPNVAVDGLGTSADGDRDMHVIRVRLQSQERFEASLSEVKLYVLVYFAKFPSLLLFFSFFLSLFFSFLVGF